MSITKRATSFCLNILLIGFIALHKGFVIAAVAPGLVIRSGGGITFSPLPAFHYRHVIEQVSSLCFLWF